MHCDVDCDRTTGSSSKVVGTSFLLTDDELESWVMDICSSWYAIKGCFLKCRKGGMMEIYSKVAEEIETLVAGARFPPGVDKCFETFVLCVTKVLEAVMAKRGSFDYVPDMLDEVHFTDRISRSPDINASDEYLPSFFRAVGLSKSQKELTNDPLLKVLRYLSMLHVVNENYGLFFGHAGEETARPVPEFYFYCEALCTVVRREVNGRTTEDVLGLDGALSSLVNIVEQYPFLVPFADRRSLLELKLDDLARRYYMNATITITVSRENMIQLIADKHPLLDRGKHTFWEFTFVDEIGTGYGPTKEFYTEFSHGCQKSELGLWMGEPDLFGLFPSPDDFPSDQSENILIALGLVMAKSILEGEQMNLDFSESFYKRLFCTDLDGQCLSIHDTRHVVPSLDNFIRDLKEASRAKRSIEASESLTGEEKAEAISKITCSGCTFEDMCLTFTLPGYSHIEMKEGGRNIFLTAENVEEYLQLLLWWMLHRGPQKNFRALQNGFKRVLPIDFFKMIYPHEFRWLFCGDDSVKWKVESLENHCILEDGLSLDTPVVRHLFQVLSDLTGEEQKKFLQFVTSRPRLPAGGLASLSPRLTVGRQPASHDPDSYFPLARTCFNRLYVTDYSCQAILRLKLMTAINESVNSFQFA